MAWAVLIVAGLTEVVWAIALKKADGFSHLGWSVVGLSVSALSLALLTVALARLPVGTAYTVWVGIGSLGVALVGIVALGEPATAARLGFLALIAIGVVGLKLTESG